MGINHTSFFAYRCTMTTPPSRQLEIFAQMVASGNIADCALALGMAEAAVKSDMRALEKRLGHQLFVISGIDVELTPVGHKMVDAMAILMPPPAVEEEAHVGDAEQSADPEPAESPVEEVPQPLPEPVFDFTEPVEEEQAPEEFVQSHEPEPESVAQSSALPDIPEEEWSAPVLDTSAESETISYPEIAQTPAIELVAEAAVEESPEPDIAPEPSTDDILELSEFVEPITPVGEEVALPSEPATGLPDPMPLPSRLIKAVPSLEDIEWPPPIKRVSWVNEEPLELTEIAPEPLNPTEPEQESTPEAPSEAVDVSEPIADRDPPAQESPEEAEVAQPTAQPIPLPIVNTLAVRVVFAAPAPATVPPPTVISLFAAVPLPVPANDPEPVPQIAPAPVIELKHAQQQVTVAAHPSVFGHFQEALTAFEQANPDVAIALELDAFTAMRAEPLLASGEVDIVYYYAMGERERFESRYVWSESLSIFIGADHRLARLDAITVEDLVGVRPVLLGSRNPLRPILDNAMIRGGVDLWHPALETDNLYDIMTAVRDGKGYFAAFGPLARDFGKMPGIRRLPLVDPLPPVEVRQAVREDVRNDPVVSSLAEYLFR